MEKQEDTLLTVGIDLGTSTTQLILSEITVENFASAFTVPRIEISDKKVIYRSEIIFTPLINQQIIDEIAIKEFVANEYHKAGISKDDIQMGAVIITGETARKQNSEKVLQALSGYAGDFVVATAGPDLESIIAGKGAGTEALSKAYSGCIVNYDIGGGTSNLAVFKNGDVVDTACFDIGGRLIKYDADTKKILYIAPKIEAIISEENLSIHVGDIVTIEKLEPIISILVQVLANASGVGEKSIYYDLLITNHGLSNPETVSSVTFSGGVADCINDVDSSWDRYGDIGLLLGRSLKESILFKERQILKTEETIRATVVGAGSHTADVSGSTISYTEDTLPVKNIPVLRLSLEDELVNPEEMSRRIQNKLEWFVSDGELPLIALALQGEKAPSFKEIQRFAEGIALGMKPIWTMGKPLLVIIESDMAKALGNSLFTYLPEGHPIICVDSIQAKNGDYVDIGMPVAGGAVLPVIIKTLVFN